MSISVKWLMPLIMTNTLGNMVATEKSDAAVANALGRFSKEVQSRMATVDATKAMPVPQPMTTRPTQRKMQLKGGMNCRISGKRKLSWSALLLKKGEKSVRTCELPVCLNQRRTESARGGGEGGGSRKEGPKWIPRVGVGCLLIPPTPKTTLLFPQSSCHSVYASTSSRPLYCFLSTRAPLLCLLCKLDS